jgi:hypothetical protein
VDHPAATARDLVAQIFSDLGKWASKEGWTGPGITRLAMELGDLPGHPAMQFAARHKASVESLLSDRLGEFGVADPRRLAKEIWLLLEGSMMLTLIHRDTEYIRAAAAAAEVLLEDRTQ